MTLPKVVIIDDDRRQIPAYELALLAAGFDPVLVKTTAGLRPILTGAAHQDASFFVVDMMMPPGRQYQSEPTAGGMCTGLFVARDLRRTFPSIPIVLWTAAHISDVRKIAQSFSLAIPHCYYADKVHMVPDDLVACLQRYQKTRRFKRGFFRKLWEAVTLRPSFAGVGIDVKKLVR